MSGLEQIIGTPQQIEAAFIYLFRGMENRRFRAFFDNGIKAKAKIDRQGYVLLNCKIYAWAAWTARQRDVVLDPADFGVAEADASYLDKLDLSFVGNWPAYRLSSFKSLVSQELFNPDINSYIGKFITKKMTFLIKSYGITRQDIENDLRASALYHIYRAYPYFDTPLHVRNVGKAAIKRAGQDLIKYHTHPARQKLQGPDFEHVHVPEVMLSTVAAPETGLDTERVMSALKPVYENYGKRGKEFLDLLVGSYDDGFSKFLGQANDRLYEVMPFEEYMGLAQQHLNISDRQREAFFKTLRQRTGIRYG